MNRIRKYGNKYQVLITPHHRFHSGFELMLGNWTDEHLKTYQVIIFNTKEDAMIKAFQHPDINWDQMVLWHKYIFDKLTDIIKYEINVNNFNDVSLLPILLRPKHLKNIMFDRIMDQGNRFRLGYHMNDIISFHITHPYTSNIQELSTILSENQALRIIYKTQDKGIIQLVGRTDLGTTYEIVLWTTLTANWARWAQQNPQISLQIKLKELDKVIVKQKTIDN
jgi:hypothetical protein